MGQFVGQLVGALLITFLLTRLGLKLTQNQSPGKRLILVHGGVWLLAGTLYGFGSADGGPFNPAGYIIYLIPVALLAAFDGLRLGREAGPTE